MRTEQEVWERYYHELDLILFSKTNCDFENVEELEWVLYISRDPITTPTENEFEDGKRMGGMQHEISIREGVQNKELRDWLLEPPNSDMVDENFQKRLLKAIEDGILVKTRNCGLRNRND